MDTVNRILPVVLLALALAFAFALGFIVGMAWAFLEMWNVAVGALDELARSWNAESIDLMVEIWRPAPPSPPAQGN